MSAIKLDLIHSAIITRVIIAEWIRSSFIADMRWVLISLGHCYAWPEPTL